MIRFPMLIPGPMFDRYLKAKRMAIHRIHNVTPPIPGFAPVIGNDGEDKKNCPTHLINIFTLHSKNSDLSPSFLEFKENQSISTHNVILGSITHLPERRWSDISKWFDDKVWTNFFFVLLLLCLYIRYKIYKILMSEV